MSAPRCFILSWASSINFLYSYSIKLKQRSSKAYLEGWTGGTLLHKTLFNLIHLNLLKCDTSQCVIPLTQHIYLPPCASWQFYQSRVLGFTFFCAYYKNENLNYNELLYSFLIKTMNPKYKIVNLWIGTLIT